MRKLIMLSLLFAVLLNVSCTGKKDDNPQKYTILAPASPASIPLILACRKLDIFEIKLFTNHTKAHASFLRGDAEFIATGYNVGVNFRKNNKNVRILSSLVGELSYLVSNQTNVDSVFKLKTKEVNLPFKGSPIELLLDSIIIAEDKSSTDEYKRHYLAFPSTIELLKRGEIENAVLPEPFVSVLLAQNKIKSYISLQKRFQDQYNVQAPQLALFTKSSIDKRAIKLLLDQVDESSEYILENQAKAVDSALNDLAFSKQILMNSTSRIGYQCLMGSELTENLIEYHKIIGDNFAPQESFVIIAEK